jgi:hypothetical protein
MRRIKDANCGTLGESSSSQALETEYDTKAKYGMLAISLLFGWNEISWDLLVLVICDVIITTIQNPGLKLLGPMLTLLACGAQKSMHGSVY